MSRRVLSEAQSAPASPFCLGKSSEPGQTGCDLRLCVEGRFEALDMERSGGVFWKNSASQADLQAVPQVGQG